MIERTQTSVFLALISLVVALAVLLPAYQVSHSLVKQKKSVDVGLINLPLMQEFTAPKWRSVDVRQIQCLADNIYYEAGYEPDLGKIAVGRVVMNRVADGRFGRTPCEVIYQGATTKAAAAQQVGGCQFSWLCNGTAVRTPREEVYKRCYDIAREILQYDAYSHFLRGVLFFHADYITIPFKVNYVQHIGRHKFYNR